MPLTFDRLPAVVVRERVWVPHELIISHEKVRQDLTIRNSAVVAAKARGFPVKEGTPEHYYLYEETEGHMIVPRAYGLVLRGRRDVDYRIVDLTGIRGELGGTDLVELGPNRWQRFDQRPGFAALSSANKLPHGRMFVLRCGGGKTPIALKAAKARGGRMLWVTVSDALIEQVRGKRDQPGDITRFLGIPYERIGHVQAARMKWEGFGVAVATLQTLSRSTKIPPEFWEYWDLVIFDEGDVLGAPAFHKVVPRFRGERWVLTATTKNTLYIFKLCKFIYFNFV